MLYPNGTTTRPTVSSPFGPRTGGAFKFHYGADLIGYSTVRACGAGLVTFAGWMNNAAGNTVIIDYGGGVSEVHMHLKSFATSRGKRIAEGATVGVMGATGNATGNCDHLEIRVNGKSVEPLAYIASRLTAGASSWNYTGRPTADIQRLVGATPDGVHGPETDTKIKTWQAGNRLIADGIWGDLSDAVGFPIKVDGDPGIRTLAKLQHRIGAKIDGQDGPDTTRHLQAALGVAVDGQRGPTTITAWQTAVGATPDGQEGPETWRKTQEFLNAGKTFPKVGTVPTTPTIPVPAATPRTPVYPGAVRGWNVPLASARTEGQIVDRFIVHHQASTNDDEEYFKTKNSRSSCPTWQVKANGDVVELIPPDMRPSSTGSWNARSVAVETQNTSGDPDWGISDVSHEAIALLVVWSAKRFGFPIDRAHVIGHRETGAATACPGPSMNLDRIVARARDIADGDGDPIVHVEVPRAELEQMRDAVARWLT